MSGREMKFRVWGYNIMREVHAIDFTGNTIQKGTPCVYNDNDGCFPIDFLMQYTGLNDKYGNEICECDILEVRLNKELTVRLQVIKDNGKYIVTSRDWKYRYNLWDVRHEAKILGNIYENPELL